MSEEFLTYYLYLAAVLFSAGVYLVITRKNAVFVLIGVELMLNGANVLLAAFSQYDPAMRGQVFAIFAVVVTVCEVAIALAVLLNIYRRFKLSDLDELTKLGNE